MLITRDSCSYRVLTDIYYWFDLTPPKYLDKCESCNGTRSCKITLDELVKLRENILEEIDNGGLL